MTVNTLNLTETQKNVNAKLPSSNRIRIVNFVQNNLISVPNVIQINVSNAMTDSHTMNKKINAIVQMIRISIRMEEDVRIRLD